MNSSNPKAASTEPVPFEKALASLEQIVHDLEEGKLGLTDSLTRYEEGVKLLKQCYTILERAERRIELLAGVDAAGNAVTQPFDHEATVSNSGEALPRGRRGGKKRGATEPNAAAEQPSETMDEPGSLF